MTPTTPTPEQLQALRDYAAYNGRCWKDKLLTIDWPRSGDRGPMERLDRWHHLQRLRNTLGPSWLIKFKLE